MARKFLSVLIITALLSITLCSHALDKPSLNAKAWVLYEKTFGEVLASHNADERLYPASITKVMTAILALEYGDPNSMVPVSYAALDGLQARGSLTYLKEGEEVAFTDMMYYLLVASGNDAANALAEHIAGSIPEFVKRMNDKAEALGCTGTNFTNPHGLHEEEHYTTANDILKICLYAMEIPQFAEIVATDYYVMPESNKQGSWDFWTTNYMLSSNTRAVYQYRGVTGIKTGTTTKAGQCLAACLPADELTFFTVVLGCEKTEDGLNASFLETKKLFDFATKHYSIKSLLKSTELITDIHLRLAADRDNISLVPEESMTALLPSDFDFADVILDYDAVESVDAPVTKGQVLGKLTVTYDGRMWGTVNLVAAEDIPRSQVLYVIDQVTVFLKSTTFRVIVLSIVALVIVFILYTVYVNRRRKKRRQKYGDNKYGNKTGK